MAGNTLSNNDNFDNNRSIEEILSQVLKDGDVSQLRDIKPIAMQSFRNLIFGSQAGANASRPNTQNNAQTGSDHLRQYQYPLSSQPPQPRTDKAIVSQPAWNNPRPLKRYSSRGLPQIVFSSMGLAFSGLASLIFLAVLLTTTSTSSFVVSMVFAPLCAVLALICAWFLGTGISKRKLTDRANLINNLFQRKKIYTIEELAAETDRLPKQIKRDLRKIKARGMLPEIYNDPDEKFFMWGQETYEQYRLSEQTRLQRLREEEERRLRLEDPATAGIEHFRSEGEVIVSKIRTAKNAIQGEEFRAKLNTLEDTTIRIFTYVERYPEKLPNTRKFMNYYLPTTLKLIEKYHQYDKMEVEPQNVRQAKAEIERSMDTINLAFDNLFESLFARDTLEVATEIDVLEKLLEQEGLTGSKFEIGSSA